MKYIKINLDLTNAYIEKEFSSVKELNEYILNLYFEEKIKRNQASELLGVSMISLSQLKYKWKIKQRSSHEKKH